MSKYNLNYSQFNSNCVTVGLSSADFIVGNYASMDDCLADVRSVMSSQNIKHIHFLTGTYPAITGTVTFDGDTVMTGTTSSILQFSTAQAKILFSNANNIRIEGLRVDESLRQITGNVNTFPFYLTDVKNVTIKDNIFTNLNAYGVFIVANTLTENVTFENNILEGNGQNDLIGAGPNGAPFGASQSIHVRNFKIVNNTFKQTISAGRNYDVAFTFVRADTITYSNNTMYGKSIVGGGEQFPNERLIVTNNHFFPAIGSNVGGVGVFVVSSQANLPASDFIISNNVIKTGGLYIQGDGTDKTEKIVISNNIISGLNTTSDIEYNRGINVSNHNNIVFSNNVVTNSYSAFSLFDAKKGVITNNTVENVTNVFNFLSSTCNNLQIGFNQLGTYTNRYINVGSSTFKDLDLATSYQLKSTDDTRFDYLSIGGTAPNVDINAFTNIPLQVSGVNTLSIGANSNLTDIKFGTSSSSTAWLRILSNGDISPLGDIYLKLNKRIHIKASNNVGNIPIASGSGVAPDQTLNFIPDTNKQSGGNIYTTFGFNSEILSYNFYSKNSGSNVSYYEMDTNTGDYLIKEGNLTINKLGKGIKIKEGTNGTLGTATLVGGTITISNTIVDANSRIFLTRKSINGSTALGQLVIGTVTNNTSFVIRAVDPANPVNLIAGDISIINWQIIQAI